MSRWILFLLTVCLLLPSANFAVFDGLPLSTFPEFAALVLLAPMVVGRALRRLHGRSLRRLGPVASRGLAVSVALALAIKLVLLVSGLHSGFLACYRTPLAPPHEGPCERSFENPLSRWTSTRIDRYIDFTPRTWNLGFVNSLRFNFYPWVPGLPDRGRLPLTVTWRGEIERSTPWVARLTYVGEAVLTIGSDTHPLPANYGPPRTVSMPVPAGRHAVALSYRFDDGYRTGQPRPSFPAATVRLARERPQGGDAAVRAVRPGLAWRVGASAADGLLGFTLLSLVGLYARLLTREWWLLAVTAVGPAVFRSFHPRWLSSEWLWLPFLIVLTVTTAVRPRPRVVLASYFALIPLSLWIAQRFVALPRTVLVRDAGHDWLTYESYARTILDTWSLQGGEDVFYALPLYRYVRFAQRLLLGEGDLFPLAAGLMALYLTVLWTIAWLSSRGHVPLRSRGWIVLVGGLVLAVLASRDMIVFMLRPLTEPASWFALLGGFALLLAARSSRAWPVGAALAGLAVGIRSNQGPAIALLIVAFLLSTPRKRWRVAATAATVFLLVLVLPLAHNLYYGRRFVLSSVQTDNPAVLTVPPRNLLAIGHDKVIRSQVLDQLRQVAYLTPLPSLALRIGLHGLQVAWLIAVGAVIARWRYVNGPARLLLLWPIAFLGVYLFYTPESYYPRHIVAGHLAMGLAAAYALSERAWRRPTSRALR